MVADDKAKSRKYHIINPSKTTAAKDLELLELIEDKGAEYEVYEPLELTETQRIVIEAVDALPQRQRDIIRLHYFHNMSLKDIAAGGKLPRPCSRPTTSEPDTLSPRGKKSEYPNEAERELSCAATHRQALRELRKNKKLRALYDHIGAIDFIRGVDDYHTSPEYFNAIRAAHKLERKLLQDSSLSYGKKQAQIFLLLYRAEQHFRQHNQDQSEGR